MGNQLAKERDAVHKRRRLKLSNGTVSVHKVTPVRHRVVLSNNSPQSSSLSPLYSANDETVKSRSSMIVFDSAIAHAESAAEDIKKQQERMKQHRRERQATHHSQGSTSETTSRSTLSSAEDDVDTCGDVCYVYDYGEESEHNRQLRQHYVLKQVFNGNHHVRLHQPRRILESACGTGLWTLEMAQSYPKCQVVGLDMVPPTHRRLGRQQQPPPNVSYTHGDILRPLPYPDKYFDFVYQRDVANVVAMDQWLDVITELHRVLRPGGQIQLVEYDLLFRSTGPVLTLVNEWYKMAAATIGVEPCYADRLPALMDKAGFTRIEIHDIDIPIGEWPSDPLQKQFGFLYKEQMKALFKSMKRWWLSELGVTEAEYDRVCQEALHEFEECHSVARWKILTAQKP